MDATTIADDPAHALLAGLLLGIYDESGTDLRSAFSRVGLAHVLSISGFHLAVMAGVMLFLIRLTGDRGALEPLIVAAMVLLYLMIVPAGSPLARSAAMVLLLLLGEALGRRYDRVTLLIWIAIALLVWRPLDLWNLGFQLSVGLTGLLLWRAGPFHARLFGAPLRGTVTERAITLVSRLRRAVALAFSCAILCWIVSTPVIVQTTGILSPIAILATILLTPLIVMSLWIGYVALLLGTLWPDAAAVTGPLLGGLARLVVACVQWGDSIPAGSVRLWPIAPLWAVAGTLVALAWVQPRPEREGARGRSHRRWSRLVATAILLLWAGQQWWGSSRLPRDVLLRIDTLSVGNGTCHIIRSADAAMLWDAGPMRGGGVLPPLLASARALNVWRIPTLVVTHPDTDHFAGADIAAETLGVREMITSPRTLAQAAARPGASAAALLNTMHERGTSVRTATAEPDIATKVEAADDEDTTHLSRTTLGTARVTFLSPPPGAAFTEDNDHSLVALFEVTTAAGPRRLLMTGDIGPGTIRTLRDHSSLIGAAAAIDILEVPHHGSFNDASLALALDLAPRAIIQSTGPARLHDARWTAAREASTWLSTAESGAFWIQIHQDGTITHGR
jgi:competence protein ComEC